MARDDEDEEKSAGAEEASSFLDDVLLQDGDEADDGDYGLELDDSQAREVRHIFFATLPQYLEPIEEMLEQLFSADEVASDLVAALTTTVASIAAAAARIEIDSARVRLEEMRDQIARLRGLAGPPPEASRTAIFAGLAALRALTADTAVPTTARARTIFAAFKQVHGIDRAVLEKLTAAGLVTVDQVQMAEPREIAAVTGLPMPVVERLISALAVADSGAPPAEAPEPELRAKLRARVEAEALLEEARVWVARLRAGNAARERELARAVARRDALRSELETARGRLGLRLAALRGARTRREAADRELKDAQDALQRTRTHVAELSHRGREAREADERRAAELATLARRVERLLSSAREVERTVPIRDPPDRP